MNPVKYLRNNSTKMLLFLILFSFSASAQTRYTGTAVDLVVSGTSTLHNWDMKSLKADCNALFNVSASGQIENLQALTFSTPANTLKSDHSSMDNNAYKALKTDKAPMITYTMTGVTLTRGSAGSTVTCNGKLTIAGTTRDEQVVAVCKANADNTITVTGTKKISMDQYGIQPPTFMLGAVKTGNDIVLSFTIILKQS
jgi:hypothetical protein